MSRAPQRSSDPQEPFDAGDERQVRAREKVSHLRAEQRLEGLKQCMASPSGRAFMLELIEISAPLQEPFDGTSRTFYRCGQGSVGRVLLARIFEHCMDNYILMMREAKSPLVPVTNNAA